jgi:D-alanyl-D-alanine carboxypeptidase
MERRAHAVLAVLLAALLMVAGCSSGDDAGEGPTAASTPTGSATAAPTPGGPAGAEGGDGGSDGAAQEPFVGLEDLVAGELAAWAQANGVPGAVAAVTIGDTVDAEPTALVATGLADAAAGTPIRNGSVFRIGSITKPITAATLLSLVEDGLVDLDEPIGTYLPSWDARELPYGGQITVRMLLDHTTGFIEYAFDPAFYLATLPRLDQPFDPEEVIDFVVGRDLLFEPGTAYSYNTGGYLLAGQIIEAVTGRPAHEVIRERILEPAGAGGLALQPAEEPAGDLVSGYFAVPTSGPEADNPLAGPLRTLAELVDPDAVITTTDGFLLDVTALPQNAVESAGWTGGGLEGTAADVVRLLPEILRGGILSPASVAAMTTTVFDVNYGLGIRVGTVEGRTAYSHGGGVPGFRSTALYLPAGDGPAVSIVILSNMIPIPTDIDVVAERIAKVALDAAGS